MEQEVKEKLEEVLLKLTEAEQKYIEIYNSIDFIDTVDKSED